LCVLTGEINPFLSTVSRAGALFKIVFLGKLSRKRILKSAPARDAVKRKRIYLTCKTHKVIMKPSILKKG
jgi:hypothetical protein